MMNTTEEQEFEIDISGLFPKFNDHLNIQNNSRILFSGKFGIGKTYSFNTDFRRRIIVINLSKLRCPDNFNSGII